MKSILDTIGNTPIIRLEYIEELYNLKAHLYAKLECFNPFGSIKDRVALKIITDAENQGLINNRAIIESSSGNLGTALAAIANIKEYKCIIVTPDNICETRKNLIKGYNAELILTDSKYGMSGATEKAQSISTKINGFYCNQFNNSSSVLAHYTTTAPEIFEDMNGNIDAIVCGIGSGGTITGIGKYFNEISPQTKIYGVLPDTFPHNIYGIGAGFKPSILNYDYVYDILYSSGNEANDMCKCLLKHMSISIGPSSGAVLSKAIKLAQSNEFDQKNIVMLFADSGEHYI